MKLLRKKRGFVSFICLVALVIGIVGLKNDIVSNASGNYFNEYEGVVTGIEHGNYYSIQSLAMYGDYAFYIKTTGEEDDSQKKAGIWAYNCATGEKLKVYNGHTDNAVFALGHANCATIVGNKLYVATCMISPAVRSYTIEKGADRFYLTNNVNYNFNQGERIITGLEYAPELGGFLAKQGNSIYLGSFSGNSFVTSKNYTLGTTLSFKNAQGNTETLNLAPNNPFIRQGIYYKDNYLYLPVCNKTAKRQSLIAAYPISSSTASGSTLKPTGNRVIRITSNQAYPHLYEIEGIANYKGKMIISVNAQKIKDKSADFLTYVKDFRF